MTRFLADEDFNNDILRGLLRRHANLDVVRVQDVGLVGAEDEEVLEAAAADGLTSRAQAVEHGRDAIEKSVARLDVVRVDVSPGDGDPERGA